jgi:hypothetical protein
MNTAKIHLTDQNFESQHSEKYDLLIRIYPKRISYAVINQNTDQLKVLVDSPGEGGLKGLKKLTDQDPILKLKYHQVKVSVQTPKFTFIPNEIYSESEIDSYALFASPVLESDVLIKEISSLKIKNISAIDKSLRKYITGNFTNAIIFNQADPLIESSLKFYHSTPKTTLSIQFNSDSFEILVLKDNSLLYYNLFSIESINEFNYFLLGVTRDLQLKSFNTDVVLSGEITEKQNFYKCVQKYFTHISFADSGMLVRQTSIFRDVIPHQFFSLISLNLCE